MAPDTALGVGRPIPEIVLPDFDGAPVRLADFRGKRLLLFVWSSR